MRLLKFSVFLAVLTIPATAYAWGPLTHVYLGSEILTVASLLPAGLYRLLKRFSEDFLYGNLMADSIIGKQFLPRDMNTHTWDVAFDLMEAAETPQQQAFVYGYLSHLAADTVAHGRLKGRRRYTGHTITELKSDSLVGRKYWFMALAINRHVKKRNDLFLESTLHSPFLSVKNNSRIYKGMVYLACLTPKRMNDFMDRNLLPPNIPTSKRIKKLHKESIERIMDVLTRGECSDVFGYDPFANCSNSKFSNLIREINEGRSRKR